MAKKSLKKRIDEVLQENEVTIEDVLERFKDPESWMTLYVVTERTHQAILASEDGDIGAKSFVRVNKGGFARGEGRPMDKGDWSDSGWKVIIEVQEPLNTYGQTLWQDGQPYADPEGLRTKLGREAAKVLYNAKTEKEAIRAIVEWALGDRKLHIWFGGHGNEFEPVK